MKALKKQYFSKQSNKNIINTLNAFEDITEEDYINKMIEIVKAERDLSLNFNKQSPQDVKDAIMEKYNNKIIEITGNLNTIQERDLES